MTADPKLVEAVARALDSTAWIPADAVTEEAKFIRRSHRRNAAKRRAHRLLSAINASGEWWVAPVEADGSICCAGAVYMATPDGPHHLGFGEEFAEKCWRAMRTAYLAKTEETK